MSYYRMQKIEYIILLIIELSPLKHAPKSIFGVFSHGYPCTYLESENQLDSLLIHNINYFNVQFFSFQSKLIQINKLLNYLPFTLKMINFNILENKHKNVFLETK